MSRPARLAFGGAAALTCALAVSWGLAGHFTASALAAVIGVTLLAVLASPQ